MSDVRSKQTVIITGGNAGLGYQCALALAQAGNWHIVLACRNPQRAAEAVARLEQASGSCELEALELDLASLASVRRFARTFVQGGRPPLHALVCNAGVQVVSGLTFTQEGHEMTFAVNHLGHFLLADLLLPHLESPGRIVFVSSGTHDPAKRTGMPSPFYRDARTLAFPEPDELPEGPGLAGRRRYTTSKLCNLLCTYAMARRFEQADLPITVNAFDPGMMPGSGLARDYGAFQRFAWARILPMLALFMPNMNTTQVSGKALARLVLDPALVSVTGRYFEGYREIPSSQESHDADKQADLWETSRNLCGLVPEESIKSLGR